MGPTWLGNAGAMASVAGRCLVAFGPDEQEFKLSRSQWR
jgi:hypothetical protein